MILGAIVTCREDLPDERGKRELKGGDLDLLLGRLRDRGR